MNKSLLFLLITILSYLQLITCDLSVFREEIRYTIYRYTLRKAPTSPLLCISDNPRDAVIWNHYLEWSSDSETNDPKSSTSELSNYAVENSDNTQCEYNIESPDCFPAWNQNGSDWNSISSFDAPMGPVYDKRWEHFSEYFKLDPNHIGYSPVKTSGAENSSYFVFHRDDALVVSIRGSANAQFLICKSRDIYRDFCYWIIIGGWHNTITAIRKCDNGIPLGVPNPGSNCSILRASVAKHFPLSAFEWKTFVITWQAKPRTIKLFDSNELILSYTDSDAIIDDQMFHVFYGNPDRTIPMLFRFHEYNYILTTKPEAKISSPPLTFDHLHEVCFDLLIGLCKDCELIVSLVDGNSTKHFLKTISSSSDYQNLKHGLPMWQYEKFSASNIDQLPPPVTLELVTKLRNNNSTSGHWALTHFEKCLPQGTVKRLSMIAVSQKRYRDQIYNRDSYYWWPNVTCQKFSYSKQEEIVVSSISEITTSRIDFNESDFKLCPALKIGAYCSTVCSQYFNNNCDYVVMCNKRGCFCSQGHTGARCGSTCERGWYGFGCTKTCSNCTLNRCDSYDGKCEGGCVETSNRFYIPPYCNIEIQSPLAPIINNLNETSVEIFVPEGNKYENVFLMYIFEIKSWTGQSEIKIAVENVINVNNTDTKVYSEVFYNLTAGTEYTMQTLVTIHYAETKYKHMESKWKSFTTSCNWDKNFEIEFSERSILISRIVEETIHPCPDQWYITDLSKFNPLANKYFPANRLKASVKFPRLFSYLEPSSNYSVCIHSENNEFNFCQNISTFEAEPSEVGYLRAESITSKQAVIKWFPPAYKNGNLLGYNLTLRVMLYKSCWFRHVDTPENLLTSKSFYANHTENFKIEYVVNDLIPYVTYEVTVQAYNSKSGVESKINFTTDQLETPTEIFEELKFENDVIKWQKPADCTTVTGAVLSSRLFLIGLSENVKTFNFQMDIISSFRVDLTEIKTINGAEDYRARVHVLHFPDKVHNETAYAEISFTTNPRPPPSVRKLEIVEVNEEEQTIMLRWKKPSPPTNGKIIYYAIRFSGKNIKTADIAYVYPNETCKLWEDLLCTTIKQPFGTREFIEVRAYNKGVNNSGEVNSITYQYRARAPSPPEIFSINEIERGIIDIKWAHPSVTGGPLKSFDINIKILSSRLKNMQTNFEKNFQAIEIPVLKYESNYSANFNLLPSTSFTISIQGVTKSSHGATSFMNIETSSKFDFEFEPKIIITGELSTINIAIPEIINNTIDSTLYVIVKGDSVCNHATIFDANTSNDFDIEFQDSAWIAASFLAHKKENHIFTVGDGQNYNGHVNCPLHQSTTYIITLIVHDSGVKSNHTIIWKSEVFQLQASIKYLHILWIIPVTVLLLIIIGSIYYYYYYKKRVTRLTMESESFSIHLTKKKINEYVVQRDASFSEQLEHQELISLNSNNSIEEINQLYGLEVPNDSLN